MRQLIVCSFSILFFMACSNPTTVDKRAEAEKLLQTSRDWAKEAESRNLEKVLSYWHDDAIMIGDKQEVLKGKAAIAEMVKGAFRDSAFRISWEPLSAEVSDDGSMGYIIENSSVTFGDPTGTPQTMHNNAVSIWRKQADGSWKNVVDITSPK